MNGTPQSYIGLGFSEQGPRSLAAFNPFLHVEPTSAKFKHRCNSLYEVGLLATLRRPYPTRTVPVAPRASR
jgi:hypothetical protein